ncbi:hypothetical protein FRX31_021924 [Thalictrum thalictroides]|uniref:Ty3 transposon capsid-like protein domain-containing protein n=1 Tax=Thalictrum thalictroides TaxID=46969 RepID=A0A7J6VTT1_THATH|nr:hypothetical protein FRX31_021924 [Thalictrum thalictroides]
MAENTRLKVLEAGQKTNEGKIAEVVDKQVIMQKDLDEIKGSLKDLKDLLLNLKNNEAPANPSTSSNNDATSTIPVGVHQSNESILGPPPSETRPVLTGSVVATQGNGFKNNGSESFVALGKYKTAKLEFPGFNGDDVRSWIRKAERYFRYNPIDSTQMVLFASLHFHGRADKWYQSGFAELDTLDWDQFTEAVRARFSEEAHENVVGEFNKLQQTTSVADYQDKFEDLKALMLMKNPKLPEGYFIDSFLSGLKGEIKHHVQMFEPESLKRAISLARLEEEAVATFNKNSIAGTKSYNSKLSPTTNSYFANPNPYKSLNSGGSLSGNAVL